jgi:hypothetical protein
MRLEVDAKLKFITMAAIKTIVVKINFIFLIFIFLKYNPFIFACYPFAG